MSFGLELMPVARTTVYVMCSSILLVSHQIDRSTPKRICIQEFHPPSYFFTLMFLEFVCCSANTVDPFFAYWKTALKCVRTSHRHTHRHTARGFLCIPAIVWQGGGSTALGCCTTVCVCVCVTQPRGVCTSQARSQTGSQRACCPHNRQN